MYQVSRPVGMIWLDLTKSPLFLAGLAIKLIFILLVIPDIQSNWFVQFVTFSINNHNLYPWTEYLSMGGGVQAFPYGPTMLIAHMPTTAIGVWLDGLVGGNYLSGFGFRLSLLFSDLMVLLLLMQQFEERGNALLIFYWLSPVVFVLTYWHGQTDVVPLSMLVASLALLKRRESALSGLFYGLSVTAKHSMLIGLPFILMYLWFNRGIVGGGKKYFLSFIVTVLIIEGWLLFSSGFQEMVLFSAELQKVYELSVSMGNYIVYILPLVYLIFLYVTWRIHKINYELLMAAMGVGFGIVILLTPASPGWYIWIMPIIALHLSKGYSSSFISIAIFSVIFTVYTVSYYSGADIAVPFSTDLRLDLYNDLMRDIRPVINTVVTGLLIILIVQLYRSGVKENDYYYFGLKPILIGIAGPNGAGKRRLSNALYGLFSKEHSGRLSQDNYKVWSDNSPMWSTVTEYDPRAYHLFQMGNDIRNIAGGKTFAVKESMKEGVYSFFRNIDIGNVHVVIVDGIHAFYSRMLCESQELKFYLEIDNALNMKKKNTDDIGSSDADISFENNRICDQINKFVSVQKVSANVMFRITSVNSDMISDLENEKNIKLVVVFVNGFYYRELVRVLVGVCGLQVNINNIGETGAFEIEIDGDVDVDDIRLASSIVVPHMEEMIDYNNGFHAGVVGLMQLIALMEVDEVLKSRKGFHYY